MNNSDREQYVPDDLRDRLRSKALKDNDPEGLYMYAAYRIMELEEELEDSNRRFWNELLVKDLKEKE